MEKKGNSKSKKKQVPMIVTRETIRDFGIREEDVTWSYIGDRRYRVLMVDADDELYKAYVNPEMAEIKREEREGRCMIRGKSGRLIRCPESNLCKTCDRDSEVCHEMNKPASLDYLSEQDEEPASEESFEDVIVSVFLEELLHILSEIQQDYERIFKMHYEGMTQKEIADEMGGGYTQRKISDAINEIQEILKPYAEEFFGR